VPKEMHLLDELFYVKCEDPKIDKEVRDAVATACKALRKQERGGRLCLILYERVSSGMWGERKVGPWEEWILHVVVRTEPAFGHREELLRRRELESRVREILWRVHNIVNSYRKHLPKEGIMDNSSVCYPFEIKDPSKPSQGGMLAGVGNILAKAVSDQKVHNVSL